MVQSSSTGASTTVGVMHHSRDDGTCLGLDRKGDTTNNINLPLVGELVLLYMNQRYKEYKNHEQYMQEAFKEMTKDLKRAEQKYLFAEQCSFTELFNSAFEEFQMANQNMQVYQQEMKQIETNAKEFEETMQSLRKALALESKFDETVLEDPRQNIPSTMKNSLYKIKWIAIDIK